MEIREAGVWGRGWGGGGGGSWGRVERVCGRGGEGRGGEGRGGEGRGLAIGDRSKCAHLSLALLYTSFLPLLASAAWDWLLSGTASCPFGDSLFPFMLPTGLAVLPSALPIGIELLPIAVAPVPSGLPIVTVLASLCIRSFAAGAAGVGLSRGCSGVVFGGLGWLVLLCMT